MKMITVLLPKQLHQAQPRLPPTSRQGRVGQGFISPTKRSDSSFGFTLIEIIVYIAILAVVSVLAVNMLLEIQLSLGEIRVTRNLSAAASVAMERMARTIRDAKSVNAGASTFNASPGVLTLTGSETPAQTHRFLVSGGALMADGGSPPSDTLTPSGVLITNLVFRLITPSATSTAVKIEMTIAATSGRATTTQNFYDTVILRNSYAP